MLRRWLLGTAITIIAFGVLWKGRTPSKVVLPIRTTLSSTAFHDPAMGGTVTLAYVRAPKDAFNGHILKNQATGKLEPCILMHFQITDESGEHTRLTRTVCHPYQGDFDLNEITDFTHEAPTGDYAWSYPDGEERWAESYRIEKEVLHIRRIGKGQRFHLELDRTYVELDPTSGTRPLRPKQTTSGVLRRHDRVDIAIGTRKALSEVVAETTHWLWLVTQVLVRKLNPWS